MQNIVDYTFTTRKLVVSELFTEHLLSRQARAQVMVFGDGPAFRVVIE
jgi:hypothetical protein